MKTYNILSWRPFEWILGGLFLLGFYFLSQFSYLLFHSLVEICSILVAGGIFMVAWNSRHIAKNPYIEFLGISYLFIAILDILHTFTYTGMGIFPQSDSNLPTQFWIAARYMESCSLLLAFVFLRRTFNPISVIFGYVSGTMVIIFAGFWSLFPDCFLEGIGLTNFKRFSEYLICTLFLSVMFLLIKKRQTFENSVWRLMLFSMALKVMSELAFTLYTDVYGFSNLLGHFLKLLSFYLLYWAIIATSLKRPYDVLFQNLKQSEQQLRAEYDRAQMYLDIVGVMLVALNREGNITLINKKGAELLGYEEKELLGKHWFTLAIPAHERARIEQTFQHILVGDVQSAEYVENLVLTKQGEERLIGWHNAFIRDQHQQIIGTLSSGEDLTERKQIEHSLRLAMQEQEQRAFEFELLNYMNNTLQTCRTEQETYPVLVEVCQKILPGSTGTVCLLRESQLSIVAHWGSVAPSQTAFDVKECAALQQYSSANPSIFPCQAQTCTRVPFLRNSDQRCLALKSPQGILGILHFSCPSSQHNDGHEKKEAIISQLAEQYALSLANLRLREQLKIEAIRDPLTGLYNRRYMEISLKREWARAERHNHAVTIIMLDIDHFKIFNDTYGHEVGDIVLRELGALLQRHVRTEDIACRYGGEEFLLILPEVILEVAKYRAEELRVLVHELGITYQGNVLPVSVSIGVAVFPQHGHDLKQVIYAADLALYRAKKEGRDRVAAASYPPGPPEFYDRPASNLPLFQE
ncbi:PAS fold family [Candidatus Vecturithrix granuli]|uniref:PAS fold family n=1 Tax=Vecturithrix granuli TaxID=1499967 RepID=A0A081C9U5_VECG1|nr:PAS fold family [Candidatus Vecturithrix granuli]